MMNVIEKRFHSALAAARSWRRLEREARLQGLYLREVQARARLDRCLTEAHALRRHLPARQERPAA